MKRLFLHGLVLGSFIVAGATASPEFEALLEPIRAKHRLPSLAAAVFDRKGVVELGAVGSRRLGESIPVTADDLWHLGSETKAITATLAGTFVAEGKLSWDAKLPSFFPEFARRIDPAFREVTYADLLSHLSGIAPNLLWENFGQRRITRARQEAAKEILTRPPEASPGSYLYSNAGYVVAGTILEKLGGKPWEELVRERIFTPLGMRSAGFGGTGTPGKLDQPWGHLESGKPVESNGPLVDNPAVMGPAGTIHASMRDWAAFLGDQLRGAAGGPALLPREIYRAIQTGRPSNPSYGLGWGIAQRPWAGGKTLTHTGSNTMNHAVCWLGLPNGWGVLVAANQAGPAAALASDEAAAALIAWQRSRLREVNAGKSN